LMCAALYCLIFGGKQLQLDFVFQTLQYSLHSPKFPRSYTVTGIQLPVSHADANDHDVSVALSDLHHGLAR